MVVLAAAIEPDKCARPLATMLTASMDTNDFFTEAHPKLRPVESPTAGMFLSGACQGPKDIPETVAQAGAAASKVIGLLCQGQADRQPVRGTLRRDDVQRLLHLRKGLPVRRDHLCRQGIPYARQNNARSAALRRSIAAVCQGCGACTVACPSGAMDLKGFSNKQIMAEVDAICR